MKKVFIAIGILLVLTLIAVLGLNIFFKNKINSFLKYSISKNVELAHGDITVNSWQGTIEINDVLVRLKKTGDNTFHTRIKSDRVSIKDLSYWDYFVYQQIHIAKIYVGKNNIVHQKVAKDSAQGKRSGPVGLNKQIIIDELEIGQTELKITNSPKDSVLLNLKNTTIKLEGINTGPKIITRKIPFTFDGLSMDADSLFVSLNPYDDLAIGKISINDHNLDLKDMSIKTHYSRAGLSEIIDKERDHIDLQIPQMAINGINWGFEGDSLFTTAKTMALSSPSLDIYRDKLVADDNKIKPLYSKMLRKLPVALMLDSLKIDNAAIVYNERVNSEGKPGQINFSKLNVRGASIGNTYPLGSKKTSLAIKGFFLNDAPLDVNWSFDVKNPSDRFRFMASVGALDAARINNFTQPNLGAKMSGRVERVYFDIDGDNDRSNISMRMNYYNFKIEVLNKKSKKNWLFSAIANVFVSKDSAKKGKENFRNGEGNGRQGQDQIIL